MENGAPPVSDKEGRTVEDARDKARAILHTQLLNTEVFQAQRAGFGHYLQK
jgi:hypothetical protein